MAKIKYSALVSEMRNKLNGSVLSKNRYGNYIRNKVTPVNPQTSYQLNQRANLSALSSQWRGLTQAQRDAWANAAQQRPFTDIFGDTKTLSGQALYVSANLNLLASGSATISEPGLSVAIPVLDSVTAVIESNASDVLQTADVTIAPAVIPAGFKLIVYATPAYSPGISFVKNKYRYLGVFSVTAGVADIQAALASRFGNYAVGEKVSCRCALVSTETGQLGLPFSVDVIVALAA